MERITNFDIAENYQTWNNLFKDTFQSRRIPKQDKERFENDAIERYKKSEEFKSFLEKGNDG